MGCERRLRQGFVLAITVGTCLSGCSALEDKASAYLSEVAIEQVTKAVDKKLEDRGLSLQKLQVLADADKSGGVSPHEAVELARDSLTDLIELKATQEGDKARAELEEKIKVLAGAKDLDELRELAGSQGLLTKGTILTLFLAMLGYATKQVFSGKADAKRDARLDWLERLFKKDLDGDGSIGVPDAVRITSGAGGASS